MYNKTGNSTNVAISVLSGGENISLDTSLVMYINNTSIPPIMIMNGIMEIKIFGIFYLWYDMLLWSVLIVTDLRP